MGLGESKISKEEEILIKYLTMNLPMWDRIEIRKSVYDASCYCFYHPRSDRIKTLNRFKDNTNLKTKLLFVRHQDEKFDYQNQVLRQHIANYLDTITTEKNIHCTIHAFTYTGTDLVYDFQRSGKIYS